MNLYDQGSGDARKSGARSRARQATAKAQREVREYNSVMSRVIDQEQRAARLHDLDARLRKIGRRG